MRHCFSRLACILFGICLMLLGGCASSPPARFYILTPLSGAEMANASVASANELAIGVGPITLPSYLDRPQIVSRVSRSKLDLAEFDQWAAPLQDNFSRVLAANLSLLIPTDRIAVFPWPRSTPIDYQISLEVLRFDGAMGGEIVLLALWSLVGTDGQELVMKKSRFTESAGAEDYEATVAAMSRTIEALSRTLAAAITSQSRQARTR